ncbi:MAG: hypothetical protein JWP27_2612 [Flaviaesturariibacter sp.]|nr:hypothetical protein [Flaviaesturariibacter sp.]
MQIEVFRTDVNTKEHADTVLDLLRRILPAGRLNFDLADRDNILRIEAREVQVQSIVSLLAAAGFICIPLES